MNQWDNVGTRVEFVVDFIEWLRCSVQKDGTGKTENCWLCSLYGILYQLIELTVRERMNKKIRNAVEHENLRIILYQAIYASIDYIYYCFSIYSRPPSPSLSFSTDNKRNGLLLRWPCRLLWFVRNERVCPCLRAPINISVISFPFCCCHCCVTDLFADNNCSLYLSLSLCPSHHQYGLSQRSQFWCLFSTVKEILSQKWLVENINSWTFM